jgi:hypothetical protein
MSSLLQEKLELKRTPFAQRERKRRRKTRERQNEKEQDKQQMKRKRFARESSSLTSPM